MCIGGPHAVRLALAAPDRVRSAVLMQPVGLSDNRDAFYALFDSWREEVAPAHPEASDADWAAFREAMWGGDFLFGASRDDLARCDTPLLVLAGDDLYHPRAVSEAVAALAPRATLLPQWKEGAARVALAQRLPAFLAAH
ncbi:MAG: hypothetical protein R3F59_13275 [Myxococcota bacterium]